MEALDIYSSIKTSLCGIAKVDGRVYPTAAPEKAKPPLVVYLQQKREDILAIDKPTGVAEYTFAIHVVASTYAEVVSVTAEVRSALYKLPTVDVRCLDVEWNEPNSEAYESNVDAQRRTPTVKILYYD